MDHPPFFPFVPSLFVTCYVVDLPDFAIPGLHSWSPHGAIVLGEACLAFEASGFDVWTVTVPTPQMANVKPESASTVQT